MYSENGRLRLQLTKKVFLETISKKHEEALLQLSNHIPVLKCQYFGPVPSDKV